MPTVEAPISHVTVFARGAVVTRRAELPEDLPEGAVEVRVEGITALAEAGSFRASVEGGERQVLSVHSGVPAPALTLLPSDLQHSLEDVRLRLEEQHARKTYLDHRRQSLTNLRLAPRLYPECGADGVLQRLVTATGFAALFERLLEDIDRRLATVHRETAELNRLQQDLQLKERQARSEEVQGDGHPSTAATVVLSGRGKGGTLVLSYTVPGARWWPTYTLRLGNGGTTAEWQREALVAQLSGENWNGVNLSLCTAELIRTDSLPRLLSLRLGKAQPPRRAGYRPPPEGLDGLFAGYDRAFGAVVQRPEPPAYPPLPPPSPPPADGYGGAAPPAAPAGYEMPPEPPSWSPPPPQYEPAPAAAPARPAPPPAPRKQAPMFPEAVREGAGSISLARMAMAAAAPSRPATGAIARAEDTQELAQHKQKTPYVSPPGVDSGVPAASWMDFDRLNLADPGDSRRGRLVLAPEAYAAGRSQAAQAIEHVNVGRKVRDPRKGRGSYDRQFDAAGTNDVPSDGTPYRVPIDSASPVPQMSYRTVPQQSPEVYREVLLQNPFKGGLLPGPMEVYVEGSLLLTTFLESDAGEGGPLYVGLGVEERLRVARNVTSDEEKTGMLSDNVQVEHTVNIQLASALGFPVTVEVVDRLPVTDDKGLKVKVVSSRPEATDYDQVERGEKIRGGLRWMVKLEPGTKSTVQYVYRLNFAAKYEVQGGNRRD